MQGQELGLKVLMGPFQLKLFCESVGSPPGPPMYEMSLLNCIPEREKEAEGACSWLAFRDNTSLLQFYRCLALYVQAWPFAVLVIVSLLLASV